MLLSDLLITLQPILNKTHRTVNVYLNENTYKSILNECHDYLNSYYLIFKIDQYNELFLINNTISFKIVHHVLENHCIVNSDHFGGTVIILTENERTIKNIIE